MFCLSSPRDNNTGDPLWPLPTQVSCVFTSLKLLFWIRVADIFLIALNCQCQFFGDYSGVPVDTHQNLEQTMLQVF